MQMERYSLNIGETIANVIVDKEFLPVIEDSVKRAHDDLIQYINSDSFFKSTLCPTDIAESSPDIVKRMTMAAARVGVGPMAAVAGAIAQQVVEDALDAGAEHVVFDNGGDIAMHLTHPITVGIYTGQKGLKNLGLRVERLGKTFGICTSSGIVGHSMSMGFADAATVYATDVALADAAATALGNAVVEVDSEHVDAALRELQTIEVEGMMVIIGETIGIYGDMPNIVRARVDYDLISKIEGGIVFG